MSMGLGLTICVPFRGPTARRSRRCGAEAQGGRCELSSTSVPRFGVRELADKAEGSTATLARVIDLLAREALLTRVRRGRVTDVEWTGCIRRRSKDYEFATPNHPTPLLAPRGLNDVTTKLKSVKWRYALTGSLAVRDTSPIAPAWFAMICVDDVESAMRTLDLRETDGGANVLLAGQFDQVVYDRTTVIDRLPDRGRPPHGAGPAASRGRGTPRGKKGERACLTSLIRRTSAPAPRS